MKSIILCEGIDDAYILGYYLHKTSDNPQWIPVEDAEKFAHSYNLAKKNSRNQRVNVYKRNEDRAAIWCVGGKDNFKRPLKDIKKFCEMFPEERVDNVFLITDRDENEIEVCIRSFENLLLNAGWSVQLENNRKSKIFYTVEDTAYALNIFPIIIPFDEQGALETVLMNGIAGEGEEEALIVSKAIIYVQSLLESKKIDKYLQHKRHVLKSKFSAVIAVTNPDRATATFDTLLMTHEWENKGEINKHFHLLRDILNQG